MQFEVLMTDNDDALTGSQPR